MNSPKAPKLPAELAMPSRLEGLLSLLVASPMSLLGCTTEPVPSDTEGSSSGGTTSGGTSSGGVADTGTTSGTTITSDGTTSTSTSGSSSSGSATTDLSTSSGSTGDASTSSTSSGGESTTTGGEQGNTCERVGDLMDMCFAGGYGYWYEYSCNWYINDAIAAGDIACAQAWNDFYACVADLECAEVNMGIYSMCDVQYDVVVDTCFDWGDTFFGTDSFGSFGSFGDSGGGFIVPPDTDGGWATSGGVWGTSGFVGGTGDSDGGVLLDLPPP